MTYLGQNKGLKNIEMDNICKDETERIQTINYIRIIFYKMGAIKGAV